MFVVVTAYAGSFGRLDFETFFIRQILETPTDWPAKVCEKLSDFRKAYMFKEELQLGGAVQPGVARAFPRRSTLPLRSCCSAQLPRFSVGRSTHRWPHGETLFCFELLLAKKIAVFEWEKTYAPSSPGGSLPFCFLKSSSSVLTMQRRASSRLLVVCVY